MARFCFHARVLYLDFLGKFKLTHYLDAGSRGAVAAFLCPLADNGVAEAIRPSASVDWNGD